jgi:hypothetical protein
MEEERDHLRSDLDQRRIMKLGASQGKYTEDRRRFFDQEAHLENTDSLDVASNVGSCDKILALRFRYFLDH